jgi:hypothetical protein
MDIGAQLKAAHDKLSARLEDEEASNDSIRDAAIEICGVLNVFWEERTRLVYNAKRVVESWEEGDLAAAVRELADALREDQ